MTDPFEPEEKTTEKTITIESPTDLPEDKAAIVMSALMVVSEEAAKRGIKTEWVDPEWGPVVNPDLQKAFSGAQSLMEWSQYADKEVTTLTEQGFDHLLAMATTLGAIGEDYFPAPFTMVIVLINALNKANDGKETDNAFITPVDAMKLSEIFFRDRRYMLQAMSTMATLVASIFDGVSSELRSMVGKTNIPTDLLNLVTTAFLSGLVAERLGREGWYGSKQFEEILFKNEVKRDDKG